MLYSIFSQQCIFSGLGLGATCSYNEECLRENLNSFCDGICKTLSNQVDEQVAGCQKGEAITPSYNLRGLKKLINLFCWFYNLSYKQLNPYSNWAA